MLSLLEQMLIDVVRVNLIDSRTRAYNRLGRRMCNITVECMLNISAEIGTITGVTAGEQILLHKVLTDRPGCQRLLA